jgi:tRNA-specific 2-thiouridylase
MKRQTVFVGLSGGVDSAVSAALLKKQGFEVVGVFIKTWHPDFLVCNEEEERHDAMRVAAHLDIPFLTFDLEKVYKKEVGDYMISEYKAGRTPNPDVMCNQHVKFGAFLKKALSMGADFVATGHYAQTTEATPPWLKKGVDPSKDQSYFLWTLRQDQLSKIIFPIGHLKKIEVRKLAEKFNLPVAKKKDSQGICFLGAVDLKNFLKHYIKEKKGKVVNERGEVIGTHDGVIFSTLGERHGFTITKKTPNDARYYIVAKDIKKNILVVSENKNNHSNILQNVKIEKTNWINGVLDQNKNYTAQIRYHGEFLSCKIVCQSPTLAEVIFEKSNLVASGQSIVLYDGEVCLGGGVVK